MKATDLARELEKIEDEDGRLTPDGVLQKAKNTKHPLHGEFEWDDSIAGHQYRLNQARVLIQKARLVVEVGSDVVKSYTYIKDPVTIETKTQGYRRITSIDDEDKYAAMRRELNRAEIYLCRAYDIGISLGYGDEIKTLLDALVETATRARPSSKSKPSARRRGRPRKNDGDRVSV